MKLLSNRQRERVSAYLILSGSYKLFHGSPEELVAVSKLRQPTQFAVPAVTVAALSALVVAMNNHSSLTMAYTALHIQAGTTEAFDFNVPVIADPLQVMMWLVLACLAIACFLIWSSFRTWNHRYVSAAAAVLELRREHELLAKQK